MGPQIANVIAAKYRLPDFYRCRKLYRCQQLNQYISEYLI